MRLIDADELRKCTIPCQIHNGALTDLCVPLYQIDNAPTVEYPFYQEAYQSGYEEGYLKGVKVGKEHERPQGEWIEGSNGNIKCNKCGAEIRYSYIANNKPDFPKFCCDCGADMRGDK
jgi:hypothetical protein